MYDNVQIRPDRGSEFAMSLRKILSLLIDDNFCKCAGQIEFRENDINGNVIELRRGNCRDPSDCCFR
jgi:hypothetical protein